MEQDLFETLRERLGHDYISDLKYEPRKFKVIRILKSLNLEAFPLRDYSDLSEYYFQDKQNFEHYNQVRFFLKKQSK